MIVVVVFIVTAVPTAAAAAAITATVVTTTAATAVVAIAAVAAAAAVAVEMTAMDGGLLPDLCMCAAVQLGDLHMHTKNNRHIGDCRKGLFKMN